MKVIIDTNIYISYLLTRGIRDTISIAIELCVMEREIELLLPQKVIDELIASVSTSKYLRRHISSTQVNSLVRDMRKASTILKSTIDDQYSTINVRDPKDRYLLELGITHEADYLVTGDSDLLVIEQISKLRIIDPHRFVSLVESYRSE
jgi:putative PIN family toxin of toxin-antitoxin system